jgi:hypothetical protein
MGTNNKHDAQDGPRRLTRFERRALAVEAMGVDERTITSAYTNPYRVRESTLRRLDKAAKKLGLPSPWNFAKANGS